ncbi:unnamed protein product [Cylicocyclus nassatus]|uniref:Uncharacterized protein n=1 Tax=Cylicocyclus nassatus TaxID=53992 RepID=A0AA36GX29_CYLNA|nr:unnamed protein product [Cylicocyclus nassatus]
MPIESEVLGADNLIRYPVISTRFASRKRHRSGSTDSIGTHTTQDSSALACVVNGGMIESNEINNCHSMLAYDACDSYLWSSRSDDVPLNSQTTAFIPKGFTVHEPVQGPEETRTGNLPPVPASIARRVTRPLNNGRNYRCSLCGDPHYTHLCRKPLPFSYRAAILLVKRRLCPKCVRQHHLSACKNTAPCEYCGRSDHATVLCQYPLM